MSKKIAIFAVLMMTLVSLSGCLGRGNGNGGKNMGSPEEVNADDYNVLYIGHSFGRIFAQTLEDLFSAVSKPIFATEALFCSTFQDLHD